MIGQWLGQCVGQWFGALGEPVEPPVVPPAPVIPPSGGWIPAYERHLARLLRRKFRRDDDEETVQAALEAAGVELPEVVTDPRADDLKRLKALVSRYEQLNLPDSRRVSRAVAFARHEKSREALERALHEIAKQVEEDEISLMVALAAIA